MANPPVTACALSDAIITAVARMVDDAQQEKRKRVRYVLTWALEHDTDRGERLLVQLIGMIRGFGGFRADSPNYVGADAVENARQAFAIEGLVLTEAGELQRELLKGLDSPETPRVLRSYVRRARRGVEDAALVVGTSKDLLEATAAYVLVVRYGTYSGTANFPTLLGQAYMAVGLTTPQTPNHPGEPPWTEVERRLFDLGCAINRLRNKEGIGHGRPFLPSVSQDEARIAIEAMALVSELLLDRL